MGCEIFWTQGGAADPDEGLASNRWRLRAAIISGKDGLHRVRFDRGVHIGVRGSRLEASGGIEYIGQESHVAGRDQKDVGVAQSPMDCHVYRILLHQRLIENRVVGLGPSRPESAPNLSPAP